MGDTGRRILLRTRWVLLVVTAMLSHAVGGAPLAPAPLGAVAREIIELQRDVALLLQAQRHLQRPVDDRLAVLKTLLAQSLDSFSALDTTVDSLAKTMQGANPNSG